MESSPPGNPVQDVNVTGHGNQTYVAGRDMTISLPEDDTALGGDGVRRFDNVWYLPRRLRFYQYVNADVGTLLIRGGHVEFRGERHRFSFDLIQDVKHTRNGGDIANNWVRVEYGERANPSLAWFSEPRRLGIDFLLGGSRKLFAALHSLAETRGA